MSANPIVLLKDPNYFNGVQEKTQELFPKVNPELIEKTLSFIRDNGERLSYLNIKFEEREDILPVPVTKLEDNHYLLHLEANGKTKPKKGSFKACYPTIEVSPTENKTKKRAELLIMNVADFKAKFPHYNHEFGSKYVMHAPLHEITNNPNCQSIIYPYYDYTIHSYFKEMNPPNSEKIEIILSFALGVQDIHRQKFVHRDLKEANGVVKFDKHGCLKVKVADLDSVIPEEGTTMADYFGTIGYVPYERPTCKTDVYSLGKILANAFGLTQVAYLSVPSSHPLSELEKQILELVLLCKVKNPDDRIGVNEFISRLNSIHPLAFSDD